MAGGESVIPWRETSIKADEAAKLFGLGKDRFLRTKACTPGFPQPVNRKPLAWVVGEVLDYRDNHRETMRRVA